MSSFEAFVTLREIDIAPRREGVCLRAFGDLAEPFLINLECHTVRQRHFAVTRPDVLELCLHGPSIAFERALRPLGQATNTQPPNVALVSSDEE